MVNEINGPPTGDIENDALRVRMEASNRNIVTMQQEHQELLREMERLRQRAAELTTRQETQQSPAAAATVVADNSAAVRTAEIAGPPTSLSAVSSDSMVSNSTTAAAIPVEGEDTATSDAESAEYIRQKIAEIAAMKAQFKRVQHMVNTANIIEEHIARDSVVADVQPNIAAADVSPPTTDAATVREAIIAQDPISCDIDFPNIDMSLLSTQSTAGSSIEEKEELLRTMLSMFNEFTTDLRDQATTLRAERDRLRALRDEMLRRKNPS